MYTTRNFRTKKALVEAFKNGEHITVFQAGPFGPSVKDGKGVVEGPHYPQPHSFYVEVEVKDHEIIKIKGVK